MANTIINYIKTITVEWWAIIFSISLGLVSTIFSFLRDKNKEKKESDKSLFKKMVESLPYQKTKEFFDSLDDKLYRQEFSPNLEEFINFVNEPNTRFNNKKIEKHKIQLFNSLKN